MVKQSMIKEASIYNGKKIASSISDAAKTGQLLVKKSEIRISLIPSTKVNSKWDKDLNVSLDSIKFLEETIEHS